MHFSFNLLSKCITLLIHFLGFTFAKCTVVTLLWSYVYFHVLTSVYVHYIDARNTKLGGYMLRNNMTRISSFSHTSALMPTFKAGLRFSLCFGLSLFLGLRSEFKEA